MSSTRGERRQWNQEHCGISRVGKGRKGRWRQLGKVLEEVEPSTFGRKAGRERRGNHRQLVRHSLARLTGPVRKRGRVRFFVGRDGVIQERF